MKEDNEWAKNEFCLHIFSISAGLVGVCLTIFGIFRAVVELKSFSSIGDNLLVVDALIFLFAGVASYIAIRSNDRSRKRKIEKIADYLFLSRLSLMAVVCLLIAYTFV